MGVANESTQPGKLSENDKIWSLSQKVKIYDPSLAKQIFISFFLDLAKEVELVIYQKNAKFSKKIIIQEV